jgi:hypothetical protein
MKRAVCEDCGWVCENHPDTPWEGLRACTCGGAGMPCPRCNRGDLDHPPRPPAGTQSNSTRRAGGIRNSSSVPRALVRACQRWRLPSWAGS